MPLLLLTAPEGLTRLISPFALYVLAAPLRFLPQQYGLPLSPELLLPESFGASAAPWIGMILAAAMGAAALVFSVRLCAVIYGMLTRPGARIPPGDVPLATVAVGPGSV